jgi:hypothetical protein
MDRNSCAHISLPGKPMRRSAALMVLSLIAVGRPDRRKYVASVARQFVQVTEEGDGLRG